MDFLTLFFSGLCFLPACFPLLYILVEEEKSWAEARSYCREKYTDLASVHNQQESEELQAAAHTHSQAPVWIGLNEDIHSWRWSLDEGRVEQYNNWHPRYLNNQGGDQSCGTMTQGGWNDFSCKTTRAFVCYNKPTYSFIYVTQRKSWEEAQTYCREHYTDLASVRNQTENDMILDLMTEGHSWIGLYRDSWEWTDRSHYSFRNWRSGRPDDGFQSNCVSLHQGQWEDLACDTKAYFVCSSPVKQQVFRIKVTTKDSVNLEDTAQDLLQQLTQKLKDAGLSEHVKLTWRKQPNGKIFTLENKEEKDTCT